MGDEDAKETTDGGSRGGEECQRRGMQIRNAWAESGRRRRSRRRGGGGGEEEVKAAGGWRGRTEGYIRGGD